MKKEKTVRTYQRRTKSGKMVTVREHKASYDAAEEARKAAAKKVGAGSELSKKKAAKEESPLGFSADDYKEWYHWDMEDDANNEAALRVEKALIKKMGKRAYNKYLKDMTDSYSARGHKKAHQALLDEHTASQKNQDVESAKTAKDIARGAKDSSKSSTTPKKKETKGDRAVARMNKMVNEALSSTTSDPKALKKQLEALIDYNGGPVNRGDKIGKRIDEIREQLGKRSSKKKGDKKSDYDYETSMKNLENYFAEERRKSTSKGKTAKAKTSMEKSSSKGTESKEPLIEDPFERAEVIRALKSKGKGQFDRVKMSRKYGKYFAKGSWNPSKLGKQLLSEEQAEAKASKTQSSPAPTKKRPKENEPISEQSLNSRGFKTFKMPQIGTLYLGKRGKGAYIRFKGKKTIQKATIDDYEDFITGHNGLTKAQKKQLSSLGYTEHEEY